MAAAKDCHALTSYFEKVYKERHGTKPVVNRNTARWNFDAILQDMKPAEVRVLIDYYLTLKNPQHSIDWFFYNYDKLVSARSAEELDRVRRAELRKQSEIRAREWNERRGK